MNFKIYKNEKLEKREILISSLGAIRFKQLSAREIGIEKGQRWLIAHDADEKPIKSIFLIRPEKEEGFKVSYANNSYAINAKGLVKELGLKLPIKCTYSPFTHGKYSGFKLSFRDGHNQ